MSLIRDATHAIALHPVPTANSEPSGMAKTLTAMLQPPPPADLMVDLCIAGSPAKMYVSAYVTRASDGMIVERRHVSAFYDSLEERMAVLEEAAQQARGLLDKLDTLAEM